MKLRLSRAAITVIALFAFTSGQGFGASEKEPAFVAAAVADPGDFGGIVLSLVNAIPDGQAVVV